MKIRPLDIPAQKTLLNARKLFLHLTRYTVPHGYEQQCYAPILHRLGFEKDMWGNWFRSIGESRTAFAAHLDTASSKVARIRHRITDNLVGTDNTTNLGADDRAGMVVLLNLMVRKVPGVYCLFVGEEVGCVGSKKSANVDEKRWTDIDRMVSFDRRGCHSVITHQCGEETCSRQFGLALAHSLSKWGLEFKTDVHGVFTDSMEFCGIIPECTNISVGYEHAHSVHETQDLGFLECLCNAAAGVQWEQLPTTRDAKATWSLGETYTVYPPSNYGCSTLPNSFDWKRGKYNPTTIQSVYKTTDDVFDDVWIALERSILYGDYLSTDDVNMAAMEDPELAAEMLLEYEEKWGTIRIKQFHSAA